MRRRQPTLSDIATIIDCEHKTAPRASPGDGYGFSIGTGRLRAGRIDVGLAKPVTRATYDDWTRRSVPREGDLIFAREAPVGQVGIVPAHPRVCLGQRTVLIRCDRELVDPLYLGYRLQAPDSQRWMTNNSGGSTVSHINVSDVRRIPLGRLPDLSGQRQIVDILEDHLSRLDAATGLLESADRRASAWSRSVVDATLWPDKYPQFQVADLLAEPMRNGHSARAVRDGAIGIRTLTLTAVTRNEFTDEFTKVTSADPHRVANLWLRSGDLLVQRANTPLLVGTTAVFNGPEDWAIYPDLLIRLRTNEQRVLSGYLCAAMRSERAHRQMRSKAKGLAGSMPKIDQAAIGSTTVPVPELEIQRALLDRVGEVESTEALTTAATKAARTRAQGLRQSLLAAAFSGRLTGRSSDLEIAEELSVTAI